MNKVIMVFLLLSLFFATQAHANTRGISIIAKDNTTGESGEVPLYARTWAVIVGIDRYLNLPADRQLKNAVHDARGVEEVLRNNYRFDEIITLVDEEATKERIMRLLTTELPSRMGKDDSLLLFWAGHGNQEKSDYGDLGYLIPYDGSVDAIYRNITMAEIRDTISKRLPAKHVFYVMDACYSGLLTATRSLDTKTRRDLDYLQEITRESVRQVLTAGGKGEEALDGGPNGHSVFTGRLIEALENAGDFITANEIQTILREKVHSDARARNHIQTPAFGTLYGTGDYVFVPNIEQKAAEVAAELKRLEQEKRELDRLEAEAVKLDNVQQQRLAQRQRQITEAKIRAEQLHLEQIAEEAKKQEQLRQQKLQLLEKRKQQELELIKKSNEEEQHLAKLRAEIERKRKTARKAKTSTIDDAVAEIKRISAEIDSVEMAFKTESSAGSKRINARYSALIADLKTQEETAKGKALERGMFETDADFQQRKQSGVVDFSGRSNELKQQRDAEISNLEQLVVKEAEAQTEPLRAELLALSEKQYTLDSTLFDFQVERYNIATERFPFALSSRPDTAVKVAFNGTINFPLAEAKEWYGHLENGFVRADVTARTDGEIVQAAIVDDASDKLLLVLEDGEFITRWEKKRREDASQALKTQALETEAVKMKKINDLGFAFVKGGCYQMGSSEGSNDEMPIHEVCFDSFAIGKYEVTQEQWQVVMGEDKSKLKALLGNKLSTLQKMIGNDEPQLQLQWQEVMGNNQPLFKGNSLPVVNVSWTSIQDYIRKLNSLSGKNFRLPTEAEWEYAARSGGLNEKYAGGTEVDALGWYKNNSNRQPSPVGQKQPNGLGLFDMSGNVWEWCADWYAEEYYSQGIRNNPQGPKSGSARVNRGGGWSSGLGRLRSSKRNKLGPTDQDGALGFRLVLPSAP